MGCCQLHRHYWPRGLSFWEMEGTKICGKSMKNLCETIIYNLQLNLEMVSKREVQLAGNTISGWSATLFRLQAITQHIEIAMGIWPTLSRALHYGIGVCVEGCEKIKIKDLLRELSRFRTVPLGGRMWSPHASSCKPCNSVSRVRERLPSRTSGVACFFWCVKETGSRSFVCVGLLSACVPL